MWAFAYEPDQIPTDEKQGFLASIGQLIVSWSNVEKRLGDLYCLAAGAHGIIVTPFHGSIEAAYYAIVSFEGRLAMNSASICRMPGSTQEIVDEWSTLANKVGRKWRIRSLVAHSGIYGTAKGKPARKIWLQPNPNSWAAVKKAKNSEIKYYKNDLDGFIIANRDLCNEISDFERRCSSAMQHAEWPPRELDLLLRSHGEGGQTRAKRSSRRPSSHG